MNFYKNISKTFHPDSKYDVTPVKPDDISPVKEKKSKENTTKNKNVLSSDSSDLKKAKTDFVLNADSLKNYSAKDSSAYTANPSSEDIVVKKDELLSTKTLEVINLNSTANRMNSKDSLLQKVSGIKDEKNIPKQFINIELWQSPLNYKGYKMSKYKISLYGIDSFEGLKVYAADDDIYVKHGNIVYKLENSSEFRPYEHITEESIINRLK